MDYNLIPNLDSYVAKYMDENGCSFDEACIALDIDGNKVFSKKEYEEFE